MIKHVRIEEKDFIWEHDTRESYRKIEAVILANVDRIERAEIY